MGLKAYSGVDFKVVEASILQSILSFRLVVQLVVGASGMGSDLGGSKLLNTNQHNDVDHGFSLSLWVKFSIWYIISCGEQSSGGQETSFLG